MSAKKGGIKRVYERGRKKVQGRTKKGLSRAGKIDRILTKRGLRRERKGRINCM